jgi:hypothetical protein
MDDLQGVKDCVMDFLPIGILSLWMLLTASTFYADQYTQSLVLASSPNLPIGFQGTDAGFQVLHPLVKRLVYWPASAAANNDRLRRATATADREKKQTQQKCESHIVPSRRGRSLVLYFIGEKSQRKHFNIHTACRDACNFRCRIFHRLPAFRIWDTDQPYCAICLELPPSRMPICTAAAC